MELAFLSAVEQARLVRTHEVSSTELVQLYLKRIARVDPELNAYVTVRGEDALAEAAAIDSGVGDAPFRGVPIAVKDLTPTAWIRTTFSSHAYADFVPEYDTAVVRRIREAGFVIVGKTNTPEFGTTAFTESDLNGATKNPWNLDPCVLLRTLRTEAIARAGIECAVHLARGPLYGRAAFEDGRGRGKPSRRPRRLRAR